MGRGKRTLAKVDEEVALELRMETTSAKPRRILPFKLQLLEQLCCPIRIL
jgi:hypothetical protein